MPKVDLSQRQQQHAGSSWVSVVSGVRLLYHIAVLANIDCLIVSSSCFFDASYSYTSDFYVHLVDAVAISKGLTSSTKLLTSKYIPTVIHFYDGG